MHTRLHRGTTRPSTLT